MSLRQYHVKKEIDRQRKFKAISGYNVKNAPAGINEALYIQYDIISKNKEYYEYKDHSFEVYYSSDPFHTRAIGNLNKIFKNDVIIYSESYNTWLAWSSKDLLVAGQSYDKPTEEILKIIMNKLILHNKLYENKATIDA